MKTVQEKPKDMERQMIHGSADASYALDFSKPSNGVSLGISDSAFGLGGTGGSLAFAGPDTQTGYGCTKRLR
jgi:hypothetical protein